MRSSDLVVKCLEAEGVERIFGIPGEENIDLMDSLNDSNIEFILTRHEQSAAFMAGIQARMTFKPRVCLSTLGPGATNLVTGVADAYLSNAPLIAITGQAGAERCFPPQKQVIDVQAMMRPVVKESFSVRSPSQVPMAVRRAFDIAKKERPGPVHIELPEDVMKAEAVGRPMEKSETEHVRPDKRSMAQIVEMIAESSRPLIIAGQGVIRAGASRELRDLCSRWNIPVIHTWFGAGSVPYDDKNSLNTIGVRASDNARQAYEKADLIVLIGFDMIEFQAKYWNIGEKKEILYLGESPMGFSEHVLPDVQVIGGLKHILKVLAELAKLKDPWAEEIRRRSMCIMEADVHDAKYIKPQNVVKILRAKMGKQDIVVSDVGAHLIWLAKYYPVYKENTLILDNGLIPMGVAVPGAIGAKMEFPEKKVAAVCGDGGFMMTMAELATAKERKIGFTTLIFNDGGYGLIRLKMEAAYGRSIACTLNNPDFVGLARSFGAEGHRVTTSDELDSVLSDCLERGALAVIDVQVDYSENQRLIT
ncbi:MAG: acetolactate synthase large subunit [Methanomassiliicoccales archaeon]|nr:MAG: acetolactate synthase large subunit [Methanomassiliicoccales archaeon]